MSEIFDEESDLIEKIKEINNNAGGNYFMFSPSEESSNLNINNTNVAN